MKRVIALALVCIIAACTTEPTRAVGHLRAGPAMRSARIFVDGIEVTNVVELNDAWVIQVHPCAPAPAGTDWVYVTPDFCQLAPPDTLFGAVTVGWAE